MPGHGGMEGQFRKLMPKLKEAGIYGAPEKEAPAQKKPKVQEKAAPVPIFKAGPPGKPKTPEVQWRNLADIQKVRSLIVELETGRNMDETMAKIKGVAMPQEHLLALGLKDSLLKAYTHLSQMGPHTEQRRLNAGRILSEFNISPGEVTSYIQEKAIQYLRKGDIVGLISMARQETLPREVTESPAFTEALHSAIYSAVARGKIYEAMDLKMRFVPKGVKLEVTPEAEEAIERGAIRITEHGSILDLDMLLHEGNVFGAGLNRERIIKKTVGTLLSRGEPARVFDVLDTLNVSERIFEEKDMQAQLVQSLGVAMKKGLDIWHIRDITQRFPSIDLSKEKELQTEALSSFIKNVEKRDFSRAADIIEVFKLQEKDTRAHVTKAYMNELRKGSVENINSYLPTANEILKQPGVREVALLGMKKALTQHNLDSAIYTQNLFGISKKEISEMLKDAAVKSELTNLIKSDLELGYYNRAATAVGLFPIDKKTALELCSKYLTGHRRGNSLLKILPFLERVHIRPHQLMQDPLVADKVFDDMRFMLQGGDFRGAINAKEQLQLPKYAAVTQKLNMVAVTRIGELLSNARYMVRSTEEAQRLFEGFGLTSKAVEPVVRTAIRTCMEAGSMSTAKLLKESFKVSDEALRKDPAIVSLAERQFMRSYALARVSEQLSWLGILEQEKMSELAQKSVLERLREGGSLHTQLNSDPLLPETFWQSPETVAAVQECLKKRLTGERPMYMHDIATVPVSAEFLSSPEIMELAEKHIYRVMQGGRSFYSDFNIDNFLEKFPLDTNRLATKEMQEALAEGAAQRLRGENSVESITEEWVPEFAKYVFPQGVPKAFMEGVYTSALAQAIENGESFDSYKELVPKEVMQSQKIQNAMGEHLVRYLSDGLAIRKEYFTYATKELLASPKLREAAEEGFRMALFRQAEGRTAEDDEHGGIASIQFIMDNYPLPPDLRRSAEFAREIFGNQFSQDQFTIILSSQRNEALPEAFMSKLRGTGLESLSPKEIMPALKEKIALFRSSLLENKPDLEILKSPFFIDILRSMVRADVAQWTPHFSFEDVLKWYTARVEKGDTSPLPDGYVQSGTVRIQKIERDMPTFTQAFTERYGVLRSDLSTASDLINFEKKPYSNIARRLAEVRDALVPKLEDKLATIENPKGKEHLMRSIEALKGINPRSVASLEKNFAVLGNYKECESILRTVSFMRALQKHRGIREDAARVAEKVTPDFDDITWFTDFVMKITHRDTWGTYFNDKQALKAFKNVTSVSALTEELARFEQHMQNSTMPMDFVPSRGLLFEYSGELADACWMAKQKSLAQTHPNMSSVTLVANRGTNNERLVGAFVLIESKTRDGKGVVIIRGLNPIENTINQLSVEDFVAKTGDYVKKIAGARGLEAAIVIDDQRGMAATNRQVVQDYLMNMRRTLKRAPLASPRDTTFNGYDITGTTYFL